LGRKGRILLFILVAALAAAAMIAGDRLVGYLDSMPLPTKVLAPAAAASVSS
jgi:hypothetical protein